jgi:hypothetical protein
MSGLGFNQEEETDNLMDGLCGAAALLFLSIL